MLFFPWKPIFAGAGPGLQNQRAALCVAGGFDPHWLPPKYSVYNQLITIGLLRHRPHPAFAEILQDCVLKKVSTDHRAAAISRLFVS